MSKALVERIDADQARGLQAPASPAPRAAAAPAAARSAWRRRRAGDRCPRRSTTCESGPCSACDSRSAATKRASAPASAITSTSDGPAGMSIATSMRCAATWRLASVTKALPGPNSLSQARHRCGAVSHRRDRLRAAELEHAVDAAQACRDEHRRIGAAVRARRRAQHDLARNRRAWPERRASARSTAAARDPAGTYRPTRRIGRTMRSQRHARRGFDGVGRRHAGAVERFDARGGIDHRLAQIGGYGALGGREFVCADGEGFQLAARRSARELAQGRVAALIAPVAGSPRPRRVRSRRRLARVAASMRRARVPSSSALQSMRQPLHASILSTGSTISPRRRRA